MIFKDWLNENKNKFCSEFTLIYVGEDCKERPMVDLIVYEQDIFDHVILVSEDIHYSNVGEGISSITSDDFDKDINNIDNIVIFTDMRYVNYLNETIRICELLRNNKKNFVLLSVSDHNIFKDDCNSNFYLPNIAYTNIIELPAHTLKNRNIAIEFGDALCRLEDRYAADEEITIGSFINSLEAQFSQY